MAGRLGNLLRRSRKAFGSSSPAAIMASPLFFTDLEQEKHPASENIFLPSKAIRFLTEKIFENEGGQAALTGITVLALGYVVVHQSIIAAHARRVKTHIATKFGWAGHPHYIRRAVERANNNKGMKI
eukprot:GHVU01061592.1.p1 GENE.GHVU01061592.1~~GHVU01061592.1.p1  ORF type:complete len:127 (-),score=17.46 GHVU01061592.1:562-942(-)